MEPSQLAHVAGKQQGWQRWRQWWIKRWQAWLQEGPIATVTTSKGCGEVQAGDQRAKRRTCLSNLRIHAIVGVIVIGCAFCGSASCIGGLVGGQSWIDDSGDVEGLHGHRPDWQDLQNQRGDLNRTKATQSETQGDCEAGTPRRCSCQTQRTNHGIQGFRQGCAKSWRSSRRRDPSC